MLSMVKLLLKGEVGVCALNSHRNYMVDHGKSWKNHGIVIFNFCGNPGLINTFAIQNLKSSRQTWCMQFLNILASLNS